MASSKVRRTLLGLLLGLLLAGQVSAGYLYVCWDDPRQGPPQIGYTTCGSGPGIPTPDPGAVCHGVTPPGCTAISRINEGDCTHD